MTATVVMSTYNGEKYLREQIDSILNQNKADILLYVRDDGSEDSTLTILGGYAEQYCNFTFTAGNNIGIGKSFYQALKNAPDSQFYAFADQDDVWLPDKVFAGINALEICSSKDEDTPLLYTCRTIPVDAELKPLETEDNYPEITFGTALLENSVRGCTFIFNDKARELLLMLPEEYVCIHDWDLLRVVLAAGGKIVQDRNGYILYRQHGSNAIGVYSDRKSKFMKLVGMRSLQDLKERLEFADCLRNIYAGVITENNRRILDILCDHKKSFSSRLALARSREIARTDRADDLFFRAMFLLGLL